MNAYDTEHMIPDEKPKRKTDHDQQLKARYEQIMNTISIITVISGIYLLWWFLRLVANHFTGDGESLHSIFDIIAVIALISFGMFFYALDILSEKIKESVFRVDNGHKRDY